MRGIGGNDIVNVVLEAGTANVWLGILTFAISCG